MQCVKEDNLIQYLASGLIAYTAQDTIDQLGDRTTYIGMSDIGKTMECLRSAVADKVQLVKDLQVHELLSLSSKKTKDVFIKQLTLQRGHWQEYGLEKAITAIRSNYIPQLEICYDYQGIPIKAHLDLTIVQDNPKPAVRVLELKSNEHIPEHLYTAYEAQIYGQVGLLVHCWNEQCFSIPTAVTGQELKNVTFPELIKAMFGITLPDDPSEVDIEAWVLSISMSDIKSFGPYIHDKMMLRTCLDQAEKLWEAKEQYLSGAIEINDLDYCRGFHPLCDYCKVNESCPKFSGISLVHDYECNATLEELSLLKAEEKQIGKRRKEIEQRLKNFYSQTMRENGDWINGQDYRFKMSRMKGRKSLDQGKILEALTSSTGSTKTASKTLQDCTKANAPYDRLYVSKINRAEVRA